MKRISLWLLVFALLSLVFFVLLIFLRIPFPVYPLMNYQDAVDLLAPLVLIPIYWLVFKYAASRAPSLTEDIAFLALSVFWIEGHGMHMTANSISNLIETLSRNRLIDVSGSSIFELTYWYDELLGHYLLHIGVLGLAALLIYREWRYPAGLVTGWWSSIPAGVVYGFTLFTITNEGQTVLLGLPFALIVTLFALAWGRKKLGQHPVLAFFFVACVMALLLYVVWGVYWGGFPEFSEVGII